MRMYTSASPELPPRSEPRERRNPPYIPRLFDPSWGRECRVESPACGPFVEFCGKLHTLRELDRLELVIAHRVARHRQEKAGGGNFDKHFAGAFKARRVIREGAHARWARRQLQKAVYVKDPFSYKPTNPWNNYGAKSDTGIRGTDVAPPAATPAPCAANPTSGPDAEGVERIARQVVGQVAAPLAQQLDTALARIAELEQEVTGLLTGLRQAQRGAADTHEKAPARLCSADAPTTSELGHNQKAKKDRKPKPLPKHKHKTGTLPQGTRTPARDGNRDARDRPAADTRGNGGARWCPDPSDADDNSEEYAGHDSSISNM